MTVAAVVAILLWIAAASRFRRWWWSRTWNLVGVLTVFTGMAAHMTVNVPFVENLLRGALGHSNGAGAVKMILFSGICFGAAILVTDLMAPSDRRRAQLLWLHASLSMLTAGGSVAFFLTAPEVPEQRDGYTFDDLYAHTSGYAEASIIAMLYPFLLCIAVTIVTARHVDIRTATGRGLMVLCPGVLVLTVYAGMRIIYVLAAHTGAIDPTPRVFDITQVLALVGVLMVAIGVLWPTIAHWVAARRALRDFLELHRALTAHWTGVVRPSWEGSSATDRVADRAAEVMDALSVASRAEGLPDGDPLPKEKAPVAIAEWILTGFTREELTKSTLGAPEGLSDVEWVRTLGVAFNTARQEELVVPE
ncbi:hypothetical protein I1A62_02650 (plasmid) [Rhodococcus sp. USK10]|uniref:hypothetical protein n=1 Tax=Rhodococcus sp. USK10 TaxID=2789739 RepID=UPI001C5E5382|nr:hypothetical protein [Rhodococcus sp. USK10]QYB00034.1 hypothetical protein I1A62_02650 [Rhodococcus sp. USK10]